MLESDAEKIFFVLPFESLFEHTTDPTDELAFPSARKPVHEAAEWFFCCRSFWMRLRQKNALFFQSDFQHNTIFEFAQHLELFWRWRLLFFRHCVQPLVENCIVVFDG